MHALKGVTSASQRVLRAGRRPGGHASSLGSLSGVLARQVNGYDVGRDLYDDSGSIDARERLDLAVLELQHLGSALDMASRHAGQLQSEIGHIGGGPADAGDQR